MFTMQNWIPMLQSALLWHQRVEGWGLGGGGGSRMDFLRCVGPVESATPASTSSSPFQTDEGRKAELKGRRPQTRRANVDTSKEEREFSPQLPPRRVGGFARRCEVADRISRQSVSQSVNNLSKLMFHLICAHLYNVDSMTSPISLLKLTLRLALCITVLYWNN